MVFIVPFESAETMQRRGLSGAAGIPDYCVSVRVSVFIPSTTQELSCDLNDSGVSDQNWTYP